MTESIKTAVNDFLKRLSLTNEVFEQDLPQNPTYPVTIYDVIDDVITQHTHDQKTGPRQARVTIEVYGEDKSEVESLMEDYIDRLAAFSGSMGVPRFTDVVIFDEGENPNPSFRQQTTLRRIEGRSRDFSVIY